MLYALGFIGLFTIGGLTGLFLATLGIDVHVHDTYFVVAHFHYIMVGGTVMGYLGGLHFWWPKITGRMYPEVLAQALGAAGLRRLQPDVLPAVRPRLPGHAAALLRLPAGVPGAERDVDGRRVDPRRRLPAAALSTSSGRCATARRAATTPGAPSGLEWETPSPPPTENFDTTPVVTHDPYDYNREEVHDRMTQEAPWLAAVGGPHGTARSAPRHRRLGPSLRHARAAARGLDARDVGLPGHRDHVLRRPVPRLRGLPPRTRRPSPPPATTSTSLLGRINTAS